MVVAQRCMALLLHYFSNNSTLCFHQLVTATRHEQNTYMKTKEKADKLKTHIMCLAMVLAGCRLDFATLAAELKLEPSSVSNYCLLLAVLITTSYYWTSIAVL
jgi:A49-like RNA polymerase I associated factor